MFNDLWELLFCPIDGILRPQMWPFIGAGIVSARLAAGQAIAKCRDTKIAEFLYCQIHGFFRHRGK